MIKRVDNPQDLGNLIDEGKPVDVEYDLGEGEKRTELIVTYTDGASVISHRIASSPLVRLYEDSGEVYMDITDSNTSTDAYSYGNLTPREAVFELPHRPKDESGYELGDVAIDLGNGRELGFSQFYRKAA